MSFETRKGIFAIATVLAFAPLLIGVSCTQAQGAGGGEVTLTVVVIETPQAKVWSPESIFARKGDTVTLKLINKHDKEHGYEIAELGIKEVVGPKQSKTVSFVATKAGIFRIKCHLHDPGHVAGQLVVLE